MSNSRSDFSISSAEEASDFSLSPDSGMHDLSQMDPISRAKTEEEWTRELAKTEEEIATLRLVLSNKVKHVHELKRKLGITVWKEFRDDMEQGIRTLQETNAYQKTSQTLKSAGEKTSDAIGSLGATVSKKLEEVKQSSSYKSFEEKIGSAYSNVKTKVSGGLNSTPGNVSTEDSSGSQIPADKS